MDPSRLVVVKLKFGQQLPPILVQTREATGSAFNPKETTNNAGVPGFPLDNDMNGWMDRQRKCLPWLLLKIWSCSQKIGAAHSM